MIKNITKELFTDAISNLAVHKPIDKITISEICRYCGAGRQTFYYHFKDKYELINWIYQSNANQILGLSDDYENFKDNVRKIYHHFVFHKQFYIKAINMDGQNSFKAALYDHSREYYISRIVNRYGKKALTDELVFSIEFNSYGAVNMCKKWMNGGMTLPPDEMADRIIDNIPEKLKKYLF